MKNHSLLRSTAFMLTLAVITACQNSSTVAEKSNDRMLVTVQRLYKASKNETVKIELDWAAIQAFFPQAVPQQILVVDQHFGDTLAIEWLDVNADEQVDFLRINAELASNEPVYTFKLSIQDSSEPIRMVQSASVPNDQLEIQFLAPYQASSQAKNMAEWMAESTLQLYPDVADFTIISPGKWTYEHGFYLNALAMLGDKSDRKEFIEYTQRWIDQYITENEELKAGTFPKDEYRLDDILPGRLSLFLYEKTGSAKYKKVADQLIEQLKKQPKTSEGGYWHKEVYPNQMWLDGIYMADVFSTQYAQQFAENEWFDEAVHQIKLMYQHAHDPQTGLLYHGWDESINPVWAHPEKGHSPEFWSRALGWYLMALVDCLDYLPTDHPERSQVVEILQSVSAAIVQHQQTNGLWYQVIHKGKEEGNWHETSATAMFSYAFAKAHRLGYLDQKYLESAQKAFEGIIQNHVYVDSQERMYLDQTGKVASLNLKNSKGDYDYYIHCERRVNDYKGLGALLYAAIELNK